MERPLTLTNRTLFILMMAILLVAFAVRFYRLEYQSLWVDEIASMNGTDPDMSWADVVKYSKSDQPPAFFLLLHGWFKVFPYSDFSGRLFSLIIGLAGIVAVFFLGKEVKDKRIGIIAALISTFSFILILFSQEVRFYTLLFLLSGLSYLFFIRAVKRERIPDFIFYTLTTAGVLYTHYFGLVVVVAQGALFFFVVIFYQVTRRFIILSVASALVVVLAILPWIPVFFHDAQATEFWIQPEPPYFFIKYFYVYFKDVISSLVFGTSLIIYFFSVYKAWRKEGRIDRVDLVLIGSVSLGFIIPIVYSLVRTPMLNVRYTLIILPCLIVMISLGVSQLKESLQKLLLITTCITSLLSLILIEQYYTKPQKEDWRGLIREVQKKASPSDILVSQKAWYCNYYLRTSPTSMRAILPEQLELQKVMPAGVWWLDGFDLTIVPAETELTLLRNGYRLVGTDSLFRMRASYYRKDSN